MKILVLIDRKNWAYHSIAKGLLKYGDVKFDVMPIKGNAPKIKKRYKKYERFLVMGWQNYSDVSFLPKRDTLVGLHGHHSWDGGQTTPDDDVEVPTKLHDLLRSFGGVNAVSKRLKKLFPYSVYTPNGVDIELFKPDGRRHRKGDEYVVGTTYTKKHDWRKGVSEFIEPACDELFLKLLPAKANVPHEEMPKYYNSIDIYVNASSSEGMSLGVLEAMACGKPVISTWPLEQEGYMLAERSVNGIGLALYQLLPMLAMDTAKQTRMSEWSWEVRAKAWTEFICG